MPKPPLRSPKDEGEHRGEDEHIEKHHRGWLERIFCLIQGWIENTNIYQRKLIMVLEDLNAAVAANTTALGENTQAVNAMIIAYQTPNASDEAIIAATTQINANTGVIQANTTALNAALAPVPPPAPTP